MNIELAVRICLAGNRFCNDGFTLIGQRREVAAVIMHGVAFPAAIALKLVSADREFNGMAPPAAVGLGIHGQRFLLGVLSSPFGLAISSITGWGCPQTVADWFPS